MLRWSRYCARREEAGDASTVYLSTSDAYRGTAFLLGDVVDADGTRAATAGTSSTSCHVSV
jgi:hypothetical protein